MSAAKAHSCAIPRTPMLCRNFCNSCTPSAARETRAVRPKTLFNMHVGVQEILARLCRADSRGRLSPQLTETAGTAFPGAKWRAQT